ncbi:MAG: hypothetical protein K1X52_15210 [Pyrinomonadaceae bacterium]|nr:hypothetical protein [Pyrinomonadaceae bacterium]
MHCPSCGQQQASEETKFCSRCGLPLGLIAEVVLQGGYLPQLAQLNEKKPPLLNKKNGVFFTIAWFIVFTMFFPAISTFFDWNFGSLSALIGVFGAMILLIGSLMLLPSSKLLPMFDRPGVLPPPQPMPATLHGRPTAGMALPPQQTQPAADYRSPGVGAWRDTNDLQPTSVTEGTTRLLDQEEAKKYPQ